MSAKRENRKVQRIKLDLPLKVTMGSIGAEMRYELETKNLSINGFFLAFDKPGRFPFTPASIMEVWLKLDEQQTIFFNGKMARVVHPGDPAAHDTGPGIAIRIVQIDRDNETHLRDFISRVSGEASSKGEYVA